VSHSTFRWNISLPSSGFKNQHEAWTNYLLCLHLIVTLYFLKMCDLMTLLVAQTVWCWMVGWVMQSNLTRIWTEAIADYFKYCPGRLSEALRKTTTIVDVLIKIRTEVLLLSILTRTYGIRYKRVTPKLGHYQHSIGVKCTERLITDQPIWISPLRPIADSMGNSIALLITV
jgi:hypothetical protein